MLDEYPIKPHELVGDRSDRVWKELVKLAKQFPKEPTWLIEESGKVTLTPLDQIAEKDGRELIEGKTILLPHDIGGLTIQGLLDGSCPPPPKGEQLATANQNDVSSALLDDSEKQIRMRLWVDGDDRDFEFPTGMRRILRIEVPSSDDEETASESWHWFELPLAEMILERNLSRLNGVFGGCLRALADSPKNADRWLVLQPVHGGVDFDSALKSSQVSRVYLKIKTPYRNEEQPTNSQVLREITDLIEKFRDAEPANYERPQLADALSRFKSAAQIENLLWGEKQPPAFFSKWSESAGEINDLALYQFIQQNSLGQRVFGIESHARLIALLARRSNLHFEEVINILRTAFSGKLRPDLSLEDRLWAIEKVLVRFGSQRQVPRALAAAPGIGNSTVSSAVDFTEFAAKHGLTSPRFDHFDMLGLMRRLTADLPNQQLSERFILKGLQAIPVPRSETDSIGVKCILPFRIYKEGKLFGSNRRDDLNNATLLTAMRVDLFQPHFLTKDYSLRPCSLIEAGVVTQRGGHLYFPESLYSELLLVLPKVNLPSGDSPQDLDKYRIDAVFDKLTYGSALFHQSSWGFYRHEALMLHDWDCDYLMNWNSTGVMTGMIPDYFHPSPSQNPEVVTARLRELVFRNGRGEAIASYRLRD